MGSMDIVSEIAPCRSVPSLLRMQYSHQQLMMQLHVLNGIGMESPTEPTEP